MEIKRVINPASDNKEIRELILPDKPFIFRHIVDSDGLPNGFMLDPTFVIDEQGNIRIVEVSLIPDGQITHTQESNRARTGKVVRRVSVY